MERGLVGDATIADSIDRRHALWRLREFIVEAQKFEGGSIKHDISVPIAAVPEFMAQADAAVKRSFRARGRCRSAISATATSITM